VFEWQDIDDQQTKLELTLIGKKNQPRPEKSYHAAH